MAKHDDLIFVAGAVVVLGSLLSGFKITWNAGREYGRRERHELMNALNQQEKDNER